MAAMNTRAINLIVIHCSATPNDRTLFRGAHGRPGFRDPAQVIDGWHAERGMHRSSYWRGRQEPRLAAIGYHFVIARNGAVFNGRCIDEVGAHAQGWNQSSIGICLVGIDQYTDYQWVALKANVTLLSKRHNIPLAQPVFGKRAGFVVRPGVCGHRDLSPDADGDGTVERHEWLKTCPGFDVSAWLKGLA